MAIPSSIHKGESHCGIKITGEPGSIDRLLRRTLLPPSMRKDNSHGQTSQARRCRAMRDQDQGVRSAFLCPYQCNQPENDNPTETKKRTHSTYPGEDDQEPMESSRERSVKHKVTVEFNDPTTIEEFNNDFKEEHLDKGMDKEEAKKEHFDFRHVTRAGLPYATMGAFPHPPTYQLWSRGGFPTVHHATHHRAHARRYYRGWKQILVQLQDQDMTERSGLHGHLQIRMGQGGHPTVIPKGRVSLDDCQADGWLRR